MILEQCWMVILSTSPLCYAAEWGSTAISSYAAVWSLNGHVYKRLQGCGYVCYKRVHVMGASAEAWLVEGVLHFLLQFDVLFSLLSLSTSC